jgi:hypothetical protein
VGLKAQTDRYGLDPFFCRGWLKALRVIAEGLRICGGDIIEWWIDLHLRMHFSV